MKKIMFALFISFFAIVFSVNTVKAVQNPGDLGSSAFGVHQLVPCQYGLVSTVSNTVTVSGTPEPVPSGSISYNNTITYSGYMSGHADHCAGWSGFCWANGNCIPYNN
jgi:hypothetical protein